MVFFAMPYHRVLILLLICCVTARENFSRPLTQGSEALTARFQSDADGLAIVSDNGSPGDGDAPLRDDPPPGDAEIPVILEVDLDPEAEELPCLGDSRRSLVFVGRCLAHKNNVLGFASFTSFCSLKRLRT